MTYHDRSELAEYAQPSPEHIKFVMSILRRASEVWSTGAPQRGGEIANDLGQRMRWKKHDVIEKAFNYLKETHESNFFPKPAKWQKAFEYVEETSIGRVGNLAKAQLLENLGDRSVPSWELEMIGLVQNFGHSDMGLKAKSEGWWGFIYENGVIPPIGLANYLAEVFSRQIFALRVWSENLSASIPSRTIEEFSTKQNQDFQQWLRSKEFFAEVKNSKMINENLFRESDLILLKNKYS